jgi:hypothetical protein
MTETIVRLVGLAAGLHGLAKYAHFKDLYNGFFWSSREEATIETPTYLDVWVLLPVSDRDWENLVWVLCGLVLIRFSKQFARFVPSRGS